jgi:nucleoside phosphorylase
MDAEMAMEIRGRAGHSKVAIITAIREEFDAVRRVTGFSDFVPETAWLCDQSNSEGNYQIIVAQAVDSSNGPCRDLLNDLKEKFMPEFVIMCGIAGGNSSRWGAELGNLIIADHVEGYETQRLAGGKSTHQKKAHDHPSYYLRGTIAERVVTKATWQQSISESRPGPGEPKVIIGNLISGEKLLGDKDNAYQKEIFETHETAKAVDMETIGLARGVYASRATRHYNLQYLVVRAISDRVDADDNQDERDQWRLYAADVAAAFSLAAANEILECT